VIDSLSKRILSYLFIRTNEVSLFFDGGSRPPWKAGL
jgi:hypothetical protein